MNDTLNVRFDVWKLHFTRGSHNLNDYPKSFRILMKFRFLECEFDEIRHSPHGFSEQEKKNYCNGNLGYNCSHKNSHFFSLSLSFVRFVIRTRIFHISYSFSGAFQLTHLSGQWSMLTISRLLEIDIGISKGTTSNNIATDTDRQNWSSRWEFLKQNCFSNVRVQIAYI